jgi:transposase
MRGDDTEQPSLFSVVGLEDRVPPDHPLRAVKNLANRALRRMDRLFDQIYVDHGRVSIPPERLLRALLLQILYSVRSERMLMEQINYNLLFRWFIGLGIDEPVWHPTTFSKNRDRFLEGDVAQEFLRQIVKEASAAGLLSSEHFSVDGTLLDAWASMKSFRSKDGDDEDPGPGRNGERNWKNEQRSNQTHASTTDPDSRLARKSNGDKSRLTYQGNIVTENRHGLVVAAGACITTGKSEREHAIQLFDTVQRRTRATVGADKGYDTEAFCGALRRRGVTPHVAAKKRGTNVDGRTTRHETYRISQVSRKRVEEPFGWAKSYGLLRKLRHKGVALVDGVMAFTMAAYNLIRMAKMGAT